MQPGPDPILKVSPETREYINRLRPELAGSWNEDSIAPAILLSPAAQPPPDQFFGSPSPASGERAGVRGLGDWLHGILFPLWLRLGGSPNCGCASRAQKLNALGARLRAWLSRTTHHASRFTRRK